MTSKIKLTSIQTLVFQQAIKASQIAQGAIEAMQAEAAVLQGKIEAAARIASRDYASATSAIAAEHGLVVLPLDAQLFMEDGQTFFKWEGETKKASKKKKKGRGRGRPPGSKNKAKAAAPKPSAPVNGAKA